MYSSAQLVASTKTLDKQLSALETNIYHREQAFLEDATLGQVDLGGMLETEAPDRRDGEARDRAHANVPLRTAKQPIEE